MTQHVTRPDTTPAEPDPATTPLSATATELRLAALTAVTRHGEAVYDYARALDAPADERARCLEGVTAAYREVLRLTRELAVSAQGGESR